MTSLPIGIWLPIKGNASTLVDREAFEAISHWRWKLDKWGYVQRNIHQSSGKSSTVFLHRVLMVAPDGKQVDHRNGDKLDNRRGNLRLATQAQNQGNRPKRPGGSSRFKGVTRSKNRWLAICGAKKVGAFDNEEDAARAYDAAALVRFGEFAFLNFPNEKAVA
jgi:hypothetical protein